MKNIYVLGSLNTDLVIESSKMPLEGETIRGKNFRTGCGGKGLNQAIAAAKLGGQVKFLGAVGKDGFGKAMVKSLQKSGINTENIREIPRISSGIAVIMLSNKNNRIILDLGANMCIEKEHVDTFLKDAKSGDIFVAQLENNLDAISYATKLAKEKGMTTILNPAPATLEIKSFVKSVDYLVPNETEYETLKKIIPSSTKLIITKGKSGYSYVSNKEFFFGLAPKVKVVDTTGAGDCFVGAFAYMLSIGKKANKETLDLVTKIASISTTRFGSSISSPTMEEVTHFSF